MALIPMPQYSASANANQNLLLCNAQPEMLVKSLTCNLSGNLRSHGFQLIAGVFAEFTPCLCRIIYAVWIIVRY